MNTVAGMGLGNWENVMLNDDVLIFFFFARQSFIHPQRLKKGKLSGASLEYVVVLSFCPFSLNPFQLI